MRDALYHHFHMPLSPEWANLPKRHCDECGKLYKQVRPRRPGEHGFCTDNCRKLFHKHKGAYSKLKGEMQKMVTKEFEKIKADVILMYKGQLGMAAPSLLAQKLAEMEQARR